MALAQVTDHVLRAQSRVLRQYTTLTGRFVPLVSAFAARVQEVEDALYAMVAMLDYTTATGVWLDRLGGIVGEARNGYVDSVFRTFISARIAVNRSLGRVDDVLDVAARLITATDYASQVFVLQQHYPAAMALTLSGGPVSSVSVIDRALRLLGRARAAGVRLVLRFQTNPDSDTFRCSLSGSLESDEQTGFATDAQDQGGHFADSREA